MQLPQNARKFLAWYMEERGVGEDAVEMTRRQVEPEEILLPDRTAAVSACHVDKGLGAIQADGKMAKAGKGLQVAAGSAAEVENCEGRPAMDVAKQRVDVLAHVVVACPFAKLLGALMIVGERAGGNFFDIPWVMGMSIHR